MLERIKSESSRESDHLGTIQPPVEDPGDEEVECCSDSSLHRSSNGNVKTAPLDWPKENSIDPDDYDAPLPKRGVG
jgi:hypothetical protein